MRLAAGGNVAAALLALVAMLAGCGGRSTAPAGAAAARSRAQVVPAARELYQTLFRASAGSVDLLDWGYQPCGTGAATLTYSISLRLFAFAPTQNTDFDAYRHQAVSLVRSAGWALRSRPPSRSEALPTVPSAFYSLSRRDGHASLSGRLGLVGDVNPLVGVNGTISLNGPCFDADGSAASLESQPAKAPFPLPSASPSQPHS